MELIKTKLDLDLNSSIFTENDNICFFDIETTGFSRQYNHIYLIGVLFYRDKHWQINQFWINDPNKENIMLEKAINFLNQFDYIINYNGNTFDIPFINARAKYHGLYSSLNPNLSFDIYSILRKNKSFLPLKNLKLESVEEYLGIYRKDQLSGKDCIVFYRKFLKTHKNKYKDKILLHNYEDLIYLLEIIKIIELLKEVKSIKFNNSNFILDQLNFSKDYLNLQAINENYQGIDIVIYNDLYSIELNKKYLNFKLPINLGLLNKEEETIASYIDLSNYSIFLNEKLLSKYQSFDLAYPIYLLKIDKTPLILNIKLFLESILENIISNN